MRKLLLSTALILAETLTLSPTVNAQDNSKPLNIDIHTYLNVSDISGSDSDDSKAKIGFGIGVGLDYTFNSGFTLSSGLDFITKGFKAKEDYFTSKGKLKANYLQIPMHAGYKVLFGDKSSLTLTAGPYLAYGVGGKVSASEGYEDFKIDTFDASKKFDLGLGLRIKYSISNFNVFMGFDHGIISAAKKSFFEESLTVYNLNFYLGVGYRF